MTVVEHRSFSKAAKHLFISQSAVSKNVSLLEKEFGAELIKRSGNSIMLTEAGKLVYDFMKEYTDSLAGLKQQIEAMEKKTGYKVNLGCLDGWNLSGFYPKMLEKFAVQYPEMELTLDGYDHVDLQNAVMDGTFDAAVMLEILLDEKTQLLKKTIASVSTLALFSSSHSTETVSEGLYGFRNEPFYIIAPKGSTENPLEELTLMLCRRNGFEPRMEYVANSNAALLKLQSGRGVQITSSWTSASASSHYSSIDLDHRLDVCVIWKDAPQKKGKSLLLEELFNLQLS